MEKLRKEQGVAAATIALLLFLAPIAGQAAGLDPTSAALVENPISVVITGIFRLLLSGLTILVLGQLFWGWIQQQSAGGNIDAMGTATGTLAHATLGLILIVVVSTRIGAIVEYFLNASGLGSISF